MIGETLGHYRIEEQLGAGGMGVVYRATDTKLGRQVAIKVLPEHFAKDAERLARFEREARMLASLNHPNIAAIHGLEESGETRYLVLELVPGETLKGPLPVEEAVRVCGQIAEALEAAHDKGIMHRDLKPANVKITPEGRVKVLDFGLAKAFAGESSDAAATVSVAGTREGSILGTPAYMSPEQARGKPLDKRTDIWAFGCVLYETLTGRKAFGGETITDCMAAVLNREPDWEALPAGTPPPVRAVLRRCLQKDAQKRLRDIGDARFELQEPAGEVAEAGAPSAPSRVGVYAAACLAAGVIAGGLLAAALWRKPPAPPAVARFTIQLKPGESLPTKGSAGFTFSPDGARLAYVAQRAGIQQIYLRALDQFEAKPIAGTDGARTPAFSPDGQWMAYFQGRKWMKVALGGGAPIAMFDAPPGGAAFAAWAPDDTLLFGLYPAGMMRMPLGGGQSQTLPVVDPNKNERWGGYPQLLPGGKWVTFNFRTADVDSFDDYRIRAFSLQTGEKKTLIEGGRQARYLPSGHLVYIRAGALYAVRFDLSRLAVTGSPVMVLDGVFESMVTDQTHFSISANGSLAYGPGGLVGGGRRPVWVDRQGKVEPLPLPPKAYMHPRLSPDGRQLAIEVEGPNHDVFLYDMGRGTLTKLTFDGSSHWPLWTPDGRRVTFRVGMPQPFTMWWLPADRSGPAEQLNKIGAQQSAASWSPDGRVVAFTQMDPQTNGDVWVLEMVGDRKPRPFVQTKFTEGSPRFSPDGRWIAYCSNESGRNEIYVQPYPGPGPKIQISTEGGTDPVWARHGKELFYRNGDQMVAVAVSLGGSLSAGRPKVLWEGPYNHGQNSLCGPPGPTSSNYDVTADGQRFLMVQEGEQDVAPTEIRVVLNWVEELKRLMAEKGKP